MMPFLEVPGWQRVMSAQMKVFGESTSRWGEANLYSLLGVILNMRISRGPIIVTHAVLVGVEQVGGGGVTGVADRTIQNDGQQDNTHPVSANEGGKSIWNCNLHHHS